MSEKEEEVVGQSIELAGELALAWCRDQVKEVAAIFPQLENAPHDQFRIGFTTACEELEERLKDIRFDAILKAVTDAMGYPQEPPDARP